MELSEKEMRRIETSWKSDVDLKLDRVDKRVGTIERLVWIATGGVAVLSIVSGIGITVLFNFSSKLDMVSSAQAAAIAEERQRAADVQRQLDYLRPRK